MNFLTKYHHPNGKENNKAEIGLPLCSSYLFPFLIFLLQLVCCQRQEDLSIEFGGEVTKADLDLVPVVCTLIIDEERGESHARIGADAFVPIKIHYNNLRKGEYYDAYSKKFKVKDRSGNDRLMELSYPSGTVSAPSGVIEASLRSLDGEYIVPKPPLPDRLDLNLISFEINLNGKNKTNFLLKAQCRPKMADVSLNSNFSHYVMTGDTNVPEMETGMFLPRGKAYNLLSMHYTTVKQGYYGAFEEVFSLPNQNGGMSCIKVFYPAGFINSEEGEIRLNIVSLNDDYCPERQKSSDPVKLLMQFAVKFNGELKSTVKLLSYPGILDRELGKTQGHRFMYGVVKDKNGRVWLNNNLGADYANMDHTVFSPEKQAQHGDDYHAFGSEFQKYRKADGHDILRWDGPDSVYFMGEFLDDSVICRKAHCKGSSIAPRQGPLDHWTTHLDMNIWDIDGENNPCPGGFRPPSRDELYQLYSSYPAGSDKNIIGERDLKLVNAGRRDHRSFNRDFGIFYYHIFDDPHAALIYDSQKNEIRTISYGTAPGLPIRCIKD